ncbi:SusC/RagA family TonB-linked outer membrane protein [Daejeonella sp.]|uniref:SusC/RagA family TonB-linked outer membrane protein n=1 Tax=Daejeonella sp. TaxID=2805397 RepID=UPI0027309B20|nr:SusC/RagA family TonB-linked outer membrane protein [Daejeonella sp.]MDP2412946.1 SusC/RagA family TonB-linked outer membrane protein [Daejeonella sp.]
MMKKVYKLVVLLLLCQTYVFAQNISVTGKVTDSDNLPLPAVSIKVSGSTQGTSTDANGSFTISVPSNATLVFTYIGFASQTISVNGRTTLNVRLESDAKQLEGVIVTALGITKDQKVLSYATQKVNTDQFQKARELNIGKSLIGRVAGLDVAGTSSGLGGSTRVVLRGDRSITGNNQALIVIDGVPMDNSNYSPGTGNGGRDGGDGLSSVNPDNIESMTVLRGASATALYGSRAANGALLISTKKGSAQKGSGVSFNSSSQLETMIELYDFQNEFGQGAGGIYNRAQEGSWGPKMTGQSVALWGNDPADAGKVYNMTPQPNNYRDFYSVGNQLSNTLAFSGGNEKAQTYFAYTRVDATGIIDNNKLTRNTLNLRLTGKVSPKLSYDSKATYLKQDIGNRQYTGEAYQNNQRHILRIPRNISLEQAKKYDYIDPSSGKLRQNYWNPGSNGGENPFWTKNRVISADNRDRITAFGSLTYQVAPSLSIMGRAGIDKTIDDFEGKWYNDTYTIADFGNYQTEFRDVAETNFDLIGIFKENILDDLTVDATFGASLQHLDRKFQNTNAGGLNRDNLFIPSNGRAPSDSRSFVQTEKQGVFATADFTYKNAITISGSVRNDWSSTLPKANQSYLFGSGGFSAILSNIFTLPTAVSFAKLRGSYATTGNDASPYLTSQFYNFAAGGNGGFISRDGTKPFPTLLPELTTALEVGLEAKFFNDRFGFDLGYYTSDSKNQLFRVSLPPASGWSSEYVNAGLVNNKGIELTINATPIVKGDFRWNLDLNYAKNVNKLVELSPTLKVLNLTNDFMVFQRAVEGESLGQMYSRGFQRDASGRVLVGVNGLPLITTGTTVYMGNSRPDWTGGFSNTFSYKGFSLNTLITARIGGSVSSFTNAIIYSDGQVAETLEGRSGFVYPGVTAAGAANTVSITSEQYWKFVGGRNSPIGEAWSYSASNVRLREASLSYALPKNLLKKAPFQAASVSLVGRNLFFIMNKAKGFDPESSAGASNTAVGQEGFSLPTTRQIGLNLNLSF